jgi:hypothetical protein
VLFTWLSLAFAESNAAAKAGLRAAGVVNWTSGNSAITYDAASLDAFSSTLRGQGMNSRIAETKRITGLIY